MIVFISCLLSLILSASWILARERIRTMDDQHPIKSLYVELSENFARSRTANRMRRAHRIVRRGLKKFGNRENPA